MTPFLKGTISDNIIFYSEERDQERMKHCAKLALIDSEIMAMPMGYHQTLIGENGGGLSEGKSNEFFWHGLYTRKPGFLLLDEATSHLDVESELLSANAAR